MNLVYESEFAPDLLHLYAAKAPSYTMSARAQDVRGGIGWTSSVGRCGGQSTNGYRRRGRGSRRSADAGRDDDRDRRGHLPGHRHRPDGCAGRATQTRRGRYLRGRNGGSDFLLVFSQGPLSQALMQRGRDMGKLRIRCSSYPPSPACSSGSGLGSFSIDRECVSRFPHSAGRGGNRRG